MIRQIGLLSGIILASAIVTSSVQAAVIDVTVAPSGVHQFEPADVVIEIGDTVRWTWDANGHNVGYGIPGAGDNSVFFSGAPASVPNQFEVTFDQAFLTLNPVVAGIYDYHCHPHGASGMVGTVTVAGIAVPAVSEWGMLVMMLLLLTGGCVIFHRRATA